MKTAIILIFLLLAGTVLAAYPYNSNPYSAYNVWDYNYTSGILAADRIGSNNTVMSADSWISSGRFGGAYNFNDVNNGKNESYRWMTSAGDARTVCTWINVSSYASCSAGAPCVIFAADDASDDWILRIENSGNLRFLLSNSGWGNYGVWSADNNLVQTNSWIHLCTRKQYGYGHNLSIYVNGSSWSGSWVTQVGTGMNTTEAAYTRIRMGDHKGGGQQFAGSMDDFLIFNSWLLDSQVSDIYNDAYVGGAPTISAINCTSCNIPNGDIVSPYTTNDTTPTFTFSTNVAANCRVGDDDQNYSTMGSSRNCASGDGTTSHTCTLTVQDELVANPDYVFFGCQNAGDNSESALSSSGALEVELTNLGDTIGNAIDSGIQNSLVWPGATVYNNQQVYLRNLANSQVLGTADRVVVYGNQRWIINYDNTTALGLFNLTPAIYTLDLVNVSSTFVTAQVRVFINSTKS